MSGIDTRNATLSIKKYFILAIGLGIMSVGLLFGIVGLEWFTFVAQSNEVTQDREREENEENRIQDELERDRLDEKNEEIANNKTQELILSNTDETIKNQNAQLGLLNKTLDAIYLQVERGNIFRNQTDARSEELLVRINKTLAVELARTANLTAEETEEVINQIRIAFNTTIPELNSRLENLTDKIDQIVQRQQVSANLTLQQDNNNKITQALELLKGNSTNRR